jgi:hypothetical protein
MIFIVLVVNGKLIALARLLLLLPLVLPPLIEAVVANVDTRAAITLRRNDDDDDDDDRRRFISYNK